MTRTQYSELRFAVANNTRAVTYAEMNRAIGYDRRLRRNLKRGRNMMTKEKLAEIEKAIEEGQYTDFQLGQLVEAVKQLLAENAELKAGK